MWPSFMSLLLGDGTANFRVSKFCRLFNARVGCQCLSPERDSGCKLGARGRARRSRLRSRCIGAVGLAAKGEKETADHREGEDAANDPTGVVWVVGHRLASIDTRIILIGHRATSNSGPPYNVVF